jgi:hypothetical protein
MQNALLSGHYRLTRTNTDKFCQYWCGWLETKSILQRDTMPHIAPRNTQATVFKEEINKFIYQRQVGTAIANSNTGPARCGLAHR